MNNVEIIKKLCREKGVSIAKLERDLNIGNGTITKSISNYMRSDRLKAIADYFGVSMEYLMTGVEPAAASSTKGYSITASEYRIVVAYRSHPEVQGSILKLLDLEEPAGSGQKESVPDGHIDNSNLSRSSELTGALKQSEQTA